MKATELMTGDLVRVSKDVCYKKGTIVKIHGIDADNVFTGKGLKGSATCMAVNDPDGVTGGVWLDYLEPIPLTAEILAQNGFSKSRLMGEQRHFTYYLGPSLSMLAIYDADFSVHIGDGARYVKNVHQFQHILKDCGIDKEIIIKED